MKNGSSPNFSPPFRKIDQCIHEKTCLKGEGKSLRYPSYLNRILPYVVDVSLTPYKQIFGRIQGAMTRKIMNLPYSIRLY